MLPASPVDDSAARCQEQQRRRELLSALSRLGASYVDLYLLAIEQLGSFELGERLEAGAQPEVTLARRFLDLLEAQRCAAPADRPKLPGHHAFRELTGAAAAFREVVAGNFPEMRDTPLWELRRLFGNVLQNQSPVGTSSRSKVKRLVQQFRMPGYPFVLVTTDILQEGEDLHTFCDRVVHYGITWTASAMEQRTGRVDRIGSLAHRRLDGRDEPLQASEKIQVHYPHLRDTVEVLQVERVLGRLNRFLTMVHTNVEDRAVDVASALLSGSRDVAPVTHRLESAFPVEDAWLDGAPRKAPRVPDREAAREHFRELWEGAQDALSIDDALGPTSSLSAFVFTGDVPCSALGLSDDESEGSAVPITLELRPEQAGSNTLIRCKAAARPSDLDAYAVKALSSLQRQLGTPKICVAEDPKHGRWEVWIEREMLFHPDSLQQAEFVELIRSAATAASLVDLGVAPDVPEGLAGGSSRDGSSRDRWQVVGKLLSQIAKRPPRGYGFEIKGSTVHATLPSQRKQRVRVSVSGDDVALSSCVLRADDLEVRRGNWPAFVRRLWEINAHTKLVAFGLDDEGDVMGTCHHPIHDLDRDELEAYLVALTRECDRLEWALTGGDRY